jgi:hypothetical protein
LSVEFVAFMRRCRKAWLNDVILQEGRIRPVGPPNRSEAAKRGGNGQRYSITSKGGER